MATSNPAQGSGCSQYALSLGVAAWSYTLAHAGRGQDNYVRQQKVAGLPAITSGHSFSSSICVQLSPRTIAALFRAVGCSHLSSTFTGRLVSQDPLFFFFFNKCLSLLFTAPVGGFWFLSLLALLILSLQSQLRIGEAGCVG